MGLGKVPLLRLRIILLSDWLYILTSISVLIMALVITNYFPRTSKYKGTEEDIIGYINHLQVDGNRLKIELIGKEKVLVNYIFTTELEKIKFLKAYYLGDTIKVSGKLTRPSNNTLFNLFNYQKYLSYHHIFYLMTAEQITKLKENNKLHYNFKQFIINRITSLNYSTAYLKVFIVGDKNEISPAIQSGYQSIGVVHLLAISGMHINLLGGGLLYILKKLKVKEISRYLIVIVFLFSYVFLTSYSASAMRAFLFFLLIFINRYYFFNIKLINLLLTTFIISVLLKPTLIYDVGLQFSYITTAYLLLFKSLITTRHYLINLFITSFIAFLASLPLTIYYFYQINLFSIIYNLFFIPLITIIIFPLSLITLFLPSCDYLLSFLIKLMEEITLIISNIKLGTIILSKPTILVVVIYYIIITYVFYMLTKGRFKALLYLPLILFIHYLSPNFNPNTILTIIDVNQGDAILLQLPHNQGNILIDTGGFYSFTREKWQLPKRSFTLSNNLLIPYFKSLGIRQIDYLIITHGHIDHLGESSTIIDNFPVRAVILNKAPSNDLILGLILHLQQRKIPYAFKGGDGTLIVNNQTLYFLNPHQTHFDENDNSLVIYTTIHKKGILLTGDISSTIENNLINQYHLNNLYLLKVAHHGSITSTSPTFLDKTAPQYAVISVGLNNRFNHPHPLVINRLKERSIKTYLTSLNGSIKYIFSKRGVTIKTTSS